MLTWIRACMALADIRRMLTYFFATCTALNDNGTWQDLQVACVTKEGRKISWFCKSEDDKADIVARVTIILSRSREFWQRVGGGARAFVHTWWHMRLSMETEFLGFGCGRPWSMSVVLVSFGKASICTDLKREAWIA